MTEEDLISELTRGWRRGRARRPQYPSPRAHRPQVTGLMPLQPAANVKRFPTYGRTILSGITRNASAMNTSPVQCMGTM